MNKKTWKEVLKDLKLNQVWVENNEKETSQFIEDAKMRDHYSDWSNLNAFLDNYQNVTASIKQGYFSGEEKNKIKENWVVLGPLFKKIAENQTNFEANRATYKRIVDEIRKHTKQKRIAATARLIASLQPKLLSDITQSKSLSL